MIFKERILKPVFKFLLFVFAGTFICFFTAFSETQKFESLKLDNFGTQKMEVEQLQAKWIFENDSANHGNSKGNLSFTNGHQENTQALLLRYELGPALNYRYVIVKLPFLSAKDFSKYKQIKFWMKGSGSKVKICIGCEDVKDYDYHNYIIASPNSGWKEYGVPLSMFKQDGWGKPKGLDLTKITLIQLQTGSMESGEKGEFAIDNIELISATTEDQLLNLEGFKEHKIVNLDQQARGCFLGVFAENFQRDIPKIHKLESMTGKKFAQIMWYQDFTKEFPLDDCQKLIKNGYVPHITWEPWFAGNTNSINLEKILSGQWDHYIKNWAIASKKLKQPFFLRFGHEFNGNWYPWSIPQNDMQAAKYIRAYRYVHNIFQKEGAKNAQWIWCPYNDTIPNHPSNNLFLAYPGNDYVDWIGIDGYNFGQQTGFNYGWNSFDDLFSAIYTAIVQKITNKPIMLAEFASGSVGGNKEAWIREMGESLPLKYPAIKSIVWFNINKETDWRIEESAQIANAFYEAVSNNYFLTSDKNLLKAKDQISSERQSYLYALPTLNPFWNKAVLSISRLTKTINIDADLSDWDNIPVSIDLNKNNAVGGASLPWNGDADFRAKIKMAADSEALYIACDVSDDYPMVNPYQEEEAWKGDCLEIVFGANPKSELDRISLDPSDYQILASTGDEKSGKPPFIWNYYQKKNGLGTVQTKKTKTGTILEMKLLFSSFGKFSPSKKTKYGFDLAFDDADLKGERDKQIIWTGKKDFYKNPGVWGLIQFESK